MKVNTVRKRILRDTLKNYVMALIILGIAAALFMGGCYLVLSRFVWYGTEPQYAFLHWVHVNWELVLVSSILLGVFLISVIFLVRVLRNMQAVIQATENIYLENDALIDLPPDLSELEAQLNQIKINMEHKERAAREAEQRKNDLIVYLAHDLKTPLTSVIGYLSLLQDEKNISEDLREKYTAIALNKSERLEDLINEFFEITRFNLSKLTLETSNVNLTRMVEQIAYEFRPMFAEKNLEYELDLEEDMYADCDVDKLERVFDNLLKNAFHYSYEGTKITIKGNQQKDNINFEFLNAGKTIPEEKLNRLFEQFFRLDSARTSGSGGAGLGLAIAKEIVELHQGTLSVWSKDERICFTLNIPKVIKK